MGQRQRQVLSVIKIKDEVRDEFREQDGALANGTYIAKKGRRIISNAANNLPVISGERLSLTKAAASNSAAVNYTDERAAGFPYFTGYCYVMDWTSTSGAQIYFGHGNSAATYRGSGDSHTYRLNAGTLQMTLPNGAAAVLGTFDTGNGQRLYMIFSSYAGGGFTGGTYLLRKDLTDGIVRLEWVNAFPAFILTGVFPFISLNASAGIVDNVRYVWLPDPWRASNPLLSATLGAVADEGLIPEFTADGFFIGTFPLAVGETADVSVRYLDDDNRLVIRFAESTASNPNTAKLIKIEAGTPEELASTAITLAVGNTFTVRVKLYGSSVVAWANFTRIGAVTETFNQTQDGGKVDIAGGLNSGTQIYPAVVTGTLLERLEAQRL